MQRKKFFENIKNILMFGLVGTFIAFASFILTTKLYMDYFKMGGMT